ncbi:MAG: hypothetical protein M3Y77_01820 [Actinomycetota bacterium]|nr:hypothetical protein [Actinomycetota bacterium]
MSSDDWALIVDAFKAAVWPVTALVIIAVFRRQLRERISALRKAGLPGGINLELDALERQVVSSAVASGAAGSLSPVVGIAPQDREDIVAETRFGLERQVRLLAWAVTRDEDFFSRGIDDLLMEVRRAGELSGTEYSQLLGYQRLSQSALAAGITDEVAGSLHTIGSILTARLNFISRVASVSRGMLGHELANHIMHSEHSRDVAGKWEWATIATVLPDVGYDYRVFQAAIIRASKTTDDRDWPRQLAPRFLNLLVTEEEFERIVRFRRDELRRLLRSFQNSLSDLDNDERYYNWPTQWGDIGWNQPIIRSYGGLRQQDIVDDLLRAEEAVRAYQYRQLPTPTS